MVYLPHTLVHLNFVIMVIACYWMCIDMHRYMDPEGTLDAQKMPSRCKFSPLTVLRVHSNPRVLCQSPLQYPAAWKAHASPLLVVSAFVVRINLMRQKSVKSAFWKNDIGLVPRFYHLAVWQSLYFAAILLEQQMVMFCPNIGLLSTAVLSLIPLIRPFAWQSLLMPVLPALDQMLDLMDAPVPFILGVQVSSIRFLS